jgi:hypothetical protein
MLSLLFKWSLLIVLQVNSAAAFFSPLNGYEYTSVRGISLHPFFVSVTEFNHNQKEKTLEISCKMFAEDFENALKTQFKTTVDFSHPKNKQAEKYVFEYLQKHLQIKINGKAVNYHFVGYEKEEEAVWGYLQVNNVPTVKKIEVTNNILYEVYNTQISIMHATVGGSRKSTRLIYPDTQASFEWE